MSDKLATLKAKNSISFKALESGETEANTEKEEACRQTLTFGSLSAGFPKS